MALGTGHLFKNVLGTESLRLAEEFSLVSPRKSGESEPWVCRCSWQVTRGRISATCLMLILVGERKGREPLDAEGVDCLVMGASSPEQCASEHITGKPCDLKLSSSLRDGTLAPPLDLIEPLSSARLVCYGEEVTGTAQNVQELSSITAE